MKTFFLILVVAATVLKLGAQETNISVLAKAVGAASQKIGTLEATNYYDREMTVTGKVAQITILKTVTFLNLDKPHPDSPFTVVIFHSHSSFYGDANALKGKSIEIRGKIKNYKDSPEIVLDSTNQLTIIGVTNLEMFLKPKAESAPANPPAKATTTNTPATLSTNLSEIM